MKTAITQLIEELRKREDRHSHNDLGTAYGYAAELAEDLLQTEKQQIIDAVTHGNRMEFYDATETTGEQYYTSTFETNKETLK